VLFQVNHAVHSTEETILWYTHPWQQNDLESSVLHLEDVDAL